MRGLPGRAVAREQGSAARPREIVGRIQVGTDNRGVARQRHGRPEVVVPLVRRQESLLPGPHPSLAHEHVDLPPATDECGVTVERDVGAELVRRRRRRELL